MLEASTPVRASYKSLGWGIFRGPGSGRQDGEERMALRMIRS